jgi:hypothetical protein
MSDKGRFLNETELENVRYPRGDNDGEPINLLKAGGSAQRIEDGMLENSIREAYNAK